MNTHRHNNRFSSYYGFGFYGQGFFGCARMM